MTAKIVTVIFWVMVVVSCSVQTYETAKTRLILEETEFICTTDLECYRDCMNLIDDAVECELGLMEGGS